MNELWQMLGIIVLLFFAFFIVLVVKSVRQRVAQEKRGSGD